MADPAVRTAALLFFYGYVATLIAAGVFGFLFALYPAWKASRLSPMEALHYE